MPNNLSNEQLHHLARLGAVARLRELEAEAAAIRKQFPGLAKAERTAGPAEGKGKQKGKRGRKRKKRQLSPEARQAISARMKARWEKKRAEDAAKGEGGEVKRRGRKKR